MRRTVFGRSKSDDVTIRVIDTPGVSWKNLVSNIDGKIYSPGGITYVFDPITEEITSFGATAYAVKGAVLAPNGKIYCCPDNTTNRFLVVDPNLKTATQIGVTISGTASKFSVGALSANGKIYFAPTSQQKIMEINPSTNTTTLIGTANASTLKHWGAVLAFDNNIYIGPYTPRDLVKLDTTTLINSNVISLPFTDASSSMGLKLAPNGKLYAIPFNSLRVIHEMDIVNNTYSTINIPDDFPIYPSPQINFSSAVLGKNGNLYFVPFTADYVLELNPITKEMRMIGSLTPGVGKFNGGVLAVNGKIYCGGYQKLLEIDTGKEDVMGIDAEIPTLETLATSNYNKYYNNH